MVIGSNIVTQGNLNRSPGWVLVPLSGIRTTEANVLFFYSHIFRPVEPASNHAGLPRNMDCPNNSVRKIYYCSFIDEEDEAQKVEEI